MAFPEDLLEQAHFLSQRETGDPKQASLRRAVSTACYALFHLLIDEMASHWGIERQRGRIGRTFDHNPMKKVCAEVCKDFRSGSPKISKELETVASAFLRLQQNRHIADYDIARNWTRTDVGEVLVVAEDAFAAWKLIRTTEEAQDYLLDMFLPKGRE
jgi:hypothetical protein